MEEFDLRKYGTFIVSVPSGAFVSVEIANKFMKSEFDKKQRKGTQLCAIEDAMVGPSLEKIIPVVNEVYNSRDVKDGIDFIAYRGGKEAEYCEDNYCDLGKFRIFNCSRRIYEFYAPDAQEKVEIRPGERDIEKFGSLWKPENKLPFSPYWGIVVLEKGNNFMNHMKEALELTEFFAESALRNGAGEEFKISVL